nr:hypothetical protein [Tanacetum cinerariifolium]
MACQIVQKKQEEKRIKEEQTDKAQNWKLSVCYDDDDDGERSKSLKDNIISGLPPCAAITPNEPIDTLSMGDGHLNTIPIDSLLDEFAGELTLLKSIPPGIDETDCSPEEETHFTKRLLYDNASPHPPKESVSKNSNAETESFSPSPIPIEDKLLDNYSLSLPVIESFYFDIPSFSRPPAKLPDGNTGIFNIKMMGDNSEQKIPIPGLTITRVLNQEKSPDLLSHRGFETFQPFTECPMMIHGKNIPILNVPLFHFYPLDQLKYRGNKVKEKQEKDKIGTKSDKNGKRGKAQQCTRPITVKKAEKKKKIQVQWTKYANLTKCID